MPDISREEIEKISEDLVHVKNDVNTIKANTQLTASILSILHSGNIDEFVFGIAYNERLCKTLIICKQPTTMKELCDSLGVKLPNLRRDVLNKLLESLLTEIDDGTKFIKFKRIAYLDLIGFDKKASEKYPNLKDYIK